MAVGEHRGNARLTEREVLEIKKLKVVIAQVLVAKQYGVHPSTISGIWRGKTWKYLQVGNKEGQEMRAENSGQSSHMYQVKT